MASSDSDSNISSKLVISLEAAYIVLSPAKLASLASFMNKNKSFMNNLNSIGPNIEPYILLKLIFLIDFQYDLFKRFVSFFLSRST